MDPPRPAGHDSRVVPVDQLRVAEIVAATLVRVDRSQRTLAALERLLGRLAPSGVHDYRAEIDCRDLAQGDLARALRRRHQDSTPP
jgi:hypothetical protein